jgi:hypothetical protein
MPGPARRDRQHALVERLDLHVGAGGFVPVVERARCGCQAERLSLMASAGRAAWPSPRRQRPLQLGEVRAASDGMLGAERLPRGSRRALVEPLGFPRRRPASRSESGDLLSERSRCGVLGAGRLLPGWRAHADRAARPSGGSAGSWQPARLLSRWRCRDARDRARLPAIASARRTELGLCRRRSLGQPGADCWRVGGVEMLRALRLSGWRARARAARLQRRRRSRLVQRGEIVENSGCWDARGRAPSADASARWKSGSAFA